MLDLTDSLPASFPILKYISYVPQYQSAVSIKMKETGKQGLGQVESTCIQSLLWSCHHLAIAPSGFAVVYIQTRTHTVQNRQAKIYTLTTGAAYHSLQYRTLIVCDR